jgi:hypothetical protein
MEAKGRIALGVAPGKPRGRTETTFDPRVHALKLGEPLPTLPLWLSQDLGVPLDLEQSYEQACADLWIS